MRAGESELAKGFIENMVELAVPDGPDGGMLPRSVTFGGDQAGQDGSQPSILAWVAWDLHERAPDEGFLQRVYPPLAASTDWWQSPRRDFDGDGLSEYAASTPVYAAYESGHDYSPERDLVMGEPTDRSADGLVHEPFADVWLNSVLYAELDALVRMAECVDPQRTEEWAQRRDQLGARVREAMWDEDLGGFFPVIRRDLCPSQPRMVRHTPAMLLPLWAGIATQEQARRTVDTVRGLPRNYPHYDGICRIRLDDDLYNGYQVLTDGLHPTAGRGAASGGVELTPTGFIARFAADRGPAVAAFNHAGVDVLVDEVTEDPWVEVHVVDGNGSTRVPCAGPPDASGRASGVIHEAKLMIELDTWMRGIRELHVRTRACRLREASIRYWQINRQGLLSRYGLRSAHPLDGKYPASGAPTEFWSGTVWGPHNFHAVQGLLRYGYEDLARSVATAYCDGVAASFISSGAAMEHHDAETGAGLGTPDYSWGAGVALTLMTDLLDRAPSLSTSVGPR